MAVSKRTSAYFDTDEGIEIEKILQDMDVNEAFNTDASYSANSDLYPDNLIPFVEKHKSYLTKHPSTDARQYLANLRLVTRKRVNFSVSY